MKDAVNEYIL